MNAPDAPRALFVTSAAFNHITGGGITFSNLFRGWPLDRIATVHSDPVAVTTDVCERYYALGAAEISRWPRITHAGVLSKYPASGSGSPPRRHPVFRSAKEALVGNAWPDTGRLTPALEAWIDAFRPQVLYSILGTIGMMELVDAIRRRFSLPAVVHFMDDWPSHLYRGGAFSWIIRAHMDRLIRTLVGEAKDRMAIGTAMAEAYSVRYGASFEPFQNVVDLESVAGHLAAPARDVSSTIRVVYVGSIFDNAQAQSLIDVAQSISRLATAGHAFSFDLHSPKHLAEPFRSRLEISNAVRLHDAVTDDGDFFRLIRDADILVLPVNFDRDSVRLIRYSMPTKLPAYLASGTPILVYGPRGVAQVDDAIDNGWGLVLERQGEDGLMASLRQLAGDSMLAHRLTERARQLVATRHDAGIVRAQFQKRLIAAANSWVP